MRPLSIFVLVCDLMLSFSASAEGKMWQLSLPLSIASTVNDASRTRVEFGAGLSAERWLFSSQRWLFGPGIGLYATLPWSRGNASVQVKTYSIFAEARFLAAMNFTAKPISIMPFAGIKTGLGTMLYHRQINKSSSDDADFLICAGPLIGMYYWIKNWGLMLSYAVSFGTNLTRQQLELSLAWRTAT